MKNNLYNNEKGQTLLIMFVMMVIALSIGIAISTRYIGGLRNITQSDLSTRAIAVAEAAVEHILLLPIETIEDYATNGTCGANCTLSITGDDGQVLTANVTLTILGSSSEPYLLQLKTDETSQVNLQGYPQNQNVYICWDEPDMSITGLYLNGAVGSYQADAFSYNPPTTSHADNNFSNAAAQQGYSSCITIASIANSNMLRLKALYNEGYVVVIPASGQVLPNQGILIESVGNAGDVTKTVTVLITDPIMPAQFDYALFQKSNTQPLSN